MNDLDMLACELEHESRLVRARNARLEAEVTVLTEMVRVLSDKLAQPNHIPDAKQMVQPEQELDYKAIGQQAYESGYTTGYMDGAIKAHEARQEQGEPVAWMNDTTPQQRTWVGLTDEEITECWEQMGRGLEKHATFAKRIEAKLKEKNSGDNNMNQKPVGVDCDCPYLNIHDAVVKDNDRLYELLSRCEVEMRYAGWTKLEADNTARNGVYEQVKHELYPTIERGSK